MDGMMLADPLVPSPLHEHDPFRHRTVQLAIEPSRSVA